MHNMDPAGMTPNHQAGKNGPTTPMVARALMWRSALGFRLPERPDNKANLLVATNSASAQRSRHFLRRYYALRQRMARGECRLVKVDDANMPADFMTKWLGGPKFRTSLAYATNSDAW